MKGIIIMLTLSTLISKKYGNEVNGNYNDDIFSH